jgi:hypothetical protein
VKLLIDECLHTSLVEVARAAGHLADHVNYLGLGSSKDWQLMATIRAQDYTFVTNNRSDFLALHGSLAPHQRIPGPARLPCVPDRIQPNVAFSPSESSSRPLSWPLRTRFSTAKY